jgi:enoyl-CoA hydratase/carnithine racemase
MEGRVSIEINNGIAEVTLIRGDKMNALDKAMFEGLVEAGERLKKESGVRVVVISGEGRAFCAGLDMSMFTTENAFSDLIERTHGISNLFQQVAWVWRELPMPVIAAVHGTAIGGGFQIMLGADMRYVHPETKLSIMEIKWGLVPDMAGTQLWTNLAREDILRELTYTGRIFSGVEALEYGFATRLADDPKAMAMEMAQEIAGKNPEAIRANKRIFNAMRNPSEDEGLMLESVEQQAIIGGANQMEAVMANMEKRAPNFKDPEV